MAIRQGIKRLLPAVFVLTGHLINVLNKSGEEGIR